MYNIVWFKRDLRLTDHGPLAQAATNGLPTLLLFLVEPMLTKYTAEYSNRHWNFMFQSLREMNQKLKPFDLRIQAVEMNALDFFQAIEKELGPFNLFSHMETGQGCTFVRDVQVVKWCRSKSIVWREYRQFGVTRGRENRDKWAQDWENLMAQDQIEVNLNSITSINIPNALQENFPVTLRPTHEHQDIQMGGSENAHALLKSFLGHRCATYSTNISKPKQSREACSRLSPHLAWGTISMRQIVHELADAHPKSKFKRALVNYKSRLFWHCHFIQKLESEPRIEFENQNRMYDTIRTELNEDFLLRWKSGNTGYPMIDACMRCLVATGYINFRMRAAMLSLWTHHLFQPWKPAATHLAQHFLDYEPGIHFPQVQMQAGTVGYHTLRVYNPTKQIIEHDPNCEFVKQWVPELANLPTDLAMEPWKINTMEAMMYDFDLERDYFKPICDLELSGKYARDQIHYIRNLPETKSITHKISKTHVNQKR
jgi:deoxyribodipyrimidine photo-lyase